MPFVHKDGHTPLLVHGDDFLAVGTRSQLDQLERVLTAAFEAKVERIGPQPGEKKSLRVLGRVISYSSKGIGYECDQTHVEMALRAYGMEDCTPVATPGYKP